MRPRQVRATELLRRGFTQREAGLAVGRSERTIRSWLRDVDGFRQAATPGAVAEGSPADMLQAALFATKSDGHPDWGVRVTAAKALMPDGYAPPVVSVPPGGMVVYPDALAELLDES